MGRIDEALGAFAEASRLSNENSKPISVAAYTLATIGQADEARAALSALEQRAQSRYVPPCAIALVHAGFSDTTKAVAWLDRALAVRDPHLIYIYIVSDPKWDPLRTDVRFQRLLERCGFAG